MSKAKILRSKLGDEDLVMLIDERFLRPHCLESIRTQASINRVVVLTELEKIINVSSRLCHPWRYGHWDWGDELCISYYISIIMHYRNSDALQTLEAIFR